jgi:hypothetical protein
LRELAVKVQRIVDERVYGTVESYRIAPLNAKIGSSHKKKMVYMRGMCGSSCPMAMARFWDVGVDVVVVVNVRVPCC